ncbi:hypothetical protein DID88_000628 [Monilinia fructigena]|uniref:Uncharacterized protein n=1 Tax=Monilinia fructigena TaxID=38457 RepID=A0A395II47_9HELO|nr:hypothetical protein DID88_000628 [Monilinia fructigena]
MALYWSGAGAICWHPVLSTINSLSKPVKEESLTEQHVRMSSLRPSSHTASCVRIYRSQVPSHQGFSSL